MPPELTAVGLGYAMVLSSVLHLAFLLMLPSIQDLLATNVELAPPPAVHVIQLAENQPKPTPPPEDGRAEPTPEPATPAPPEEGPEAGKEGQEQGEGSDGASKEGDTKAPEPVGNSSTPPVETAASSPPQPPLGGNAKEGEEKPQGEEEKPPEGGLPAGAVPVVPGIPAEASLPENEMLARGVPLDPDEVVVPKIGEQAQAVPAAPPGSPIWEDQGVGYNWNSYMWKMIPHLGQSIAPKMPATIDPRAANPTVHIVILRNGTVRTAKVLRSSGIQEIDDAVMSVLQQPLPALPADFPKESVSVTLEFALPKP